MKNLMANNYIVIDNTSIDVQNMLKKGGDIDQNIKFRKRFQDLCVEELNNEGVFRFLIKDNKNNHSVEFKQSDCGTVIIEWDSI